MLSLLISPLLAPRVFWRRPLFVGTYPPVMLAFAGSCGAYFVWWSLEVLDRLIPNCGDIDSSAASSAPEQGAHIRLDRRTFLQCMSQGARSMSQGLRVLVSVHRRTVGRLIAGEGLRH